MALSETWFLDGDIDFELQKYRLLAYLQQVNKYFKEYKLYPQLSDIIFHYRNLDSFRKNKELLQNNFPKQLDRADMEQLKLVYSEMLDDDGIMQELEQITGYAMQQIKGSISHGTELYEEIEKQLTIEPIGIQPLYRNEGYMMLHFGHTPDVMVYNYTVSLFTHKEAKYRSLQVKYINTWQKNLSVTYEHLKTKIIQTIKELPNPAVYLMESPIVYPVDETLLPIAKRTLIRYISTDAA